MVSDLQRLRRYKLQEGDGEPDSNLAELIADIHWAADEIERLRKGWESLEWESKQEIERLEAALKDIVAADHCIGGDYCPHCIARDALEDKDE
jgi:hypothetical protein